MSRPKEWSLMWSEETGYIMKMNVSPNQPPPPEATALGQLGIMLIERPEWVKELADQFIVKVAALKALRQ